MTESHFEVVITNDLGQYVTKPIKTYTETEAKRVSDIFKTEINNARRKEKMSLLKNPVIYVSLSKSVARNVLPITECKKGAYSIGGICLHARADNLKITNKLRGAATAPIRYCTKQFLETYDQLLSNDIQYVKIWDTEITLEFAKKLLTEPTDRDIDAFPLSTMYSGKTGICLDSKVAVRQVDGPAITPEIARELLTPKR